MKTTEVEARVALVAAHKRYQYGRWSRWLSGSLQVAGHAHQIMMNARNLAHDFSVKLSPCMFSHVSAAVAGKMTGIFVTYALSNLA